MKFIRRRTFRNLYIFICIFITAFLFFKSKWYKEISALSHIDLEKNVQEGIFPDSNAVPSGKEIDWRNLEFERIESSRIGLGEQGKPSYLSSFDKQKKEEIWDTNGFDGLLSDSISLQRALEDIRHPQCKTLKYNSVLPTVSVIIPFFEEHFSTLLRTVVSVANRSPPEILKEIILVDDGSSMKDELKAPLDDWLKKNQPKASVLHLPERVGLIMARQKGAEAATADVIVVLDSHCEVMRGWLPPLLEPILNDYRTAVCPFIDVINSNTFAYSPQDNGGRGAFDWRLYYKRLPLRQSDINNLPAPFENPVMNGGLFAISRKFFWELGGYDTGIKIWGGEQYNLSFKIWMCGGRLLDAPCSRVGHLFRLGGKNRPAAKNAGDFISVNYKRLAVGWMDEYAEALYKRNPKLRTTDEGDLTSEKELRERLQCKSFSWFLKEVVPDLEETFPAFEPPDYANGTIKSEAMPSMCIDSASRKEGPPIIYQCHGMGPQYFSLNWRKTIAVEDEQFCWNAPHSLGQPPFFSHCQIRTTPPIQQWRYDPVMKTIRDKIYKRCLEINPTSNSLSMEICVSNKPEQRWIFKQVDTKLIEKEFPPFT